MSLLRESLGAEFDQYKADAAASKWMFQSIGDMDRDELLALIGWMGEERLREQAQHRHDVEFMTRLRGA